MKHRRSAISLRVVLLWLPVYLWVFPWTIAGLIVGLLPGAGKPQFRVRRGTLGIFGRPVERWLRKSPIAGGAWAMTLGHVILACDERAWIATFEHEFVHVRQYQWFGPFFVPAYFAECFWQWCRGRDPYIANRFEVQARKYS